MTPVSWTVVDDSLRIYRGHELVAEFHRDAFPRLMLDLARALAVRQ